DRGLVGVEAWLKLNYRKSGFDVGLRLDYFKNSNLLNPTDAYSDKGLGIAYLSKEFGDLHVTVGHMYEQIGSGIIFKAYEERALLLDNALLGARARYQLSSDWQLTAFGGRQKHLFDLYASTLAGGKLEGFAGLKEGALSLAPGIGLITKTLSDGQMDDLANVLSTYTPEDFIDKAPFHNFALSLYNTLQYGPVTWYFEGAYKSKDVFLDLYATRSLWTGEQTLGKYVLESGYVIYNAISYARGKVGITLESKVTSDFNYRADPLAVLNRGMINFLPPMARFNTYRLTSRYTPATQDLGEIAGQLEASFRPNLKQSYLINGSWINDLSGTSLYREIFTELTFKKPRKHTVIGGLQFQWYNQERYEGKTDVPFVKTVTPYVDYLYRFSRTTSLRTEVQYMHTDQDWGSWLFILAEFGIAPHWVFELSDMWNITPYVDRSGVRRNDPLHFPTVGVTYSHGGQRISMRYVKQVEGVVCSGGICRLEPAFSGLRILVSTQF
ncbi:MAG: DUF6029 family protein, partial [Saprospiraceae bacterium]|nr:DUF6029 family protein [Saprospiraceae bacterium]